MSLGRELMTQETDADRRSDQKGHSLNRHEGIFNRRWFFAYIACSLAAIFYLPSMVSQHAAASDSYVFGYNNRAGIVLLLVFVTVGSMWTKGLNLQLRTTGVSQPIPLKDLICSLIAVLSVCLAMYMFAGRFGGFGESSYEIDRAWLLSQGRVPYVDFEWPFGPALLYGPLLLGKLLPIGIVQAYYLFWIINCLAGTLLLFTVVNLIDYPTNSRRAIYFLLFGAWFLAIVNMGTHYTLLRYTCPLYSILVVQKYCKASSTQSRAYGVMLAVAFTFILLLISPEIAIAHAFACVCIFLVSSPNPGGRDFALFFGLVLALAVLFWAALRLHMLDTVRASGRGADSFPIAFSPHILLFFAAVFVCACYVFRRFSEGGARDNTIGLIAYSVPILAAALGRCDPGHVVLNGLGIFLASMFYVSNQRTAWKWYRSTFVVVLIVLPALSGIWFFRTQFTTSGFNILRESNKDSRMGRSLTYLAGKYLAFSSPAKRAKWEERLEHLKHGAVPETIDFSTVYPGWHGRFLAPFGYKPNGLGSYLSNQVDYGHFEAFENANSVDAIGEKLAEIKDHPEKALLLPDGFERSCQIDVPAERQEISILFAFPYFGKAVHAESVRQPICDYILSQYRLEQEPALQNFMYGLWVARPIAGETSQDER